MVFQQFSLIGSLTVRENLALVLPQGAWWIGRGARRLAAIDRHLAAVLPEIDPNARVADLSVGQVQSVELAKVLLLRARCVSRTTAASSRPPAGTSPTRRPARITLTRSAQARTSASLWVIRTTERPRSASWRIDRHSCCASVGESTALGSSRI
jgi:ABC-type transporter Mla maintaining outer membrane lipid asymmetry ATPase subunit MlaF